MATRRRLSMEARKVLAETAKAERVHAKTIRDAFFKLIDDYGDQFDEQTVLAYLSTGNLPNITSEFREYIGETLEPLWRELIDVGSELQDPAGSVRGVLAETTRNQHIDQWIQERGSELVTNFSTQQRRSVNAIVEYAQGEGHSTQDIADSIRGVVGLTERQSEAIVKMEREMTEAGLSRREIIRARTRRRRQMEQQRANTIARTEISAAVNEGTIAAAKAEDVDEGDGLTSRMFIRAYPDCCSQCREIEDSQPSNGISLEGEWEMWGRPPFHPNCRCVVVIERLQI